jgi:hypothetical protein
LWCAAVVTASIAGCKCWNPRGQGYGDQAESWTKHLRPPADERRLSGLDAKARDIERNLGVR